MAFITSLSSWLRGLSCPRAAADTTVDADHHDLVGSTWHLKPTADPFFDETRIRIYITDMKNGYIQYRYEALPTLGALTYSMSLRTLRTLYEREEEK